MAWNFLFFWQNWKSQTVQVFLEWHNRHTRCPVLILCVSSNLLKDESRSWSASANEALGRLCFKTKGMISKWRPKVARQMELCGTEVMEFITCFFLVPIAHPATHTGGERPAFGGGHRKGHCINPVEVKCLVVQSLMSQNRCSFGMMPLATPANPVVVSHFSVWKLNKEIPTDLGKPPRENLLW